MTLRILSTTALALSLLGGAAFAQEQSASQRVLDNPEMMSGFYSDSTMSQMKSAEEMGTAYSAMTPESQAAMKAECATNTDAKYTDFCASINAM